MKFHLRLEQPSAEWPRDVDDLVTTKWHPKAFQQFILKIHSRCNLACGYCYVYRSADQTWKDQPVRMSEATVERTAERIAEHAEAHTLQRVEVVLHGGEPLLAGPEFIAFVSKTMLATIPSRVAVDRYVQTNATLLKQPILDVLLKHNVRVGVSYDGDPATHDSQRIHPNGRGSYAELARGLKLLRQPAYRELFAGFLCVVDPESDPVATYESLLEHEPPAVDFLLPHANWSRPPAHRDDSQSTPYGDWLVEMFDRWYSAPQRETSVRLFEEVIRGLLGKPSQIESIGLSPARLVVVETDGTIEQSDALKSTFEGAAYTGLHVERDAFDAVLSIPQVVARQIGESALCETCRRCDIRHVCGAGFFPHRYRQGSGFLNPSVYCRDLQRLIRHVRKRVLDDLTPIRVSVPR